MKKFGKILMLSMFMMVFMSVSAWAASAPEVDTTNNYIYANGTPIIIVEGAIAGTTSVYVDTNENGVYEIGTDTEVAGAIDVDLSTYSIYGGSENTAITGDTKITMTGGSVVYVYGGGAESTATVGSTSVTMSGGIVQNVFGGGENGSVTGSTSVEIKGSAYIKGSVFGGGEFGPVTVDSTSVEISGSAEIKGNVFGGGANSAATVKQDTKVIISGETVGNVFGGGYQGTVTGSTAVTISGGTVQNVFGGGHYASVTGSTAVAISGGTVVELSVYGGGWEGEVGSTAVEISDSADIKQNVYGGGRDTSATVGEDTKVTILGGAVSGYVYGGGESGSVTGSTALIISGGTMEQNVYGGGKESSATAKSTAVEMKGGTLTKNLYGGGNEGSVTGSTTVTISGGTVNYVLGGGDDADVGSTSVEVKDSAEIKGSVYGGGNYGAVTDSTSVTILGGKIGTVGNVSAGYVYGGGNEGPVTGSTSVTMSGGTVNYLYGGGFASNAPVGQDTSVTISGGTVSEAVYGGGQLLNATVGQDTRVTMSGGTVNNVYGGCNMGAVKGSTTVTISGGTVNNVYGGGEISTSTVAQNTAVTISGGTVSEAVYGGGLKGTVTGFTAITISGGNVKNVYGSGASGNVNGNATIAYASGAIDRTAILGNSPGGKVLGKVEIIEIIPPEAPHIDSVYHVEISQTGEGEISPDGGVDGQENITEGNSRTFYFTPADGYYVEKFFIDGEEYEGSDSVTFEDVQKNHTLRVVFTSENEETAPETPSGNMPFNDISVNDWFYESVKYVYENGLMNGITTSSFAPNENTTRAMVWTILARMDGVDTSNGDTWYSIGQAWAIENGVSDGTNPTGLITREELVTMLWRYMGSPELADYEGLTNFSDIEELATYAQKAMAWAHANGIITGKTGGILDPNGLATRAEISAMIERL